MMKKLLCIFFLLISGMALNAQQLFFMDSAGTPLEVNIHAVPQAGSEIHLVSSKGYALLPSPGRYHIKAHAMGFLDYSDSVNIVHGAVVKIIMTAASVSIDDIVVTAQVGAKTTSGSVIPVRVIDRKKLDLMAAQTLKDVLTNETGIRISQDNILGSSISMQGLTGENIKILIDGVPVIGRQNGNIDLSQIDMTNVERIEIAEGPLSIMYGSNALGGVINIITRKNVVAAKRFLLKEYVESIGTSNTALTGSGKIKKMSITGSLNHNYFDGWKAGEPFELIPKKHLADTNRFKTWKPRQQDMAGLNIGYAIKSWQLLATGNFFNEQILNRGMPRAPYFESAFDDIYRTRRLDYVLEVNHSYTKKSSFNGLVAYNSYRRIKNTYQKDLTSLEQQLTPAAEDQDTTRFHLLNIRTSCISSVKKLSYNIGTDINIETAEGRRLMSGSGMISDYALFGVAERTFLDRLTVRAGLRGAYNSKYQPPLLPSMHMKWYLNPKSILRLSYARGYRAPELKELYFYFVDFNHNILGNPGLKAEESNSINLQYNYVARHHYILYKLEIKGFYNQIHNLITLAQVQGIEYTYFNIGLYKTAGAQLAVDMTYEHLRINVGMNYIGRYNQLTENYPVEKFSFSPEFKSSVSYTIPKYKTQVNLFYKYNGRIPVYVLSNGAISQQYIDHYNWADFSVTRNFNKSFTFGAGVKNIFNITDIRSAATGTVHTSGNSMQVGTGRFYFLNLIYVLAVHPAQR
jgi:outer membrane receptor for ferrienterochelin and colicins